MKNRVIKIIVLILMITSIISVMFNKCQAVSDVTEDLDYWEPDEVVSTSLEEKIEYILGIVSFIGIMISVITLSVIGIKFIIGSAEEKAQYKQTLMPWLIGATLVFSVTTLPSVIYNIVHDGSNSNSTKQVQISINKSSVTLTVGENEEVTLKATVISDTNRIVKWTTSNSQVATVDSKGKVTARSVGTAIIKAYTGKAEATCEVIVDAVLTSNIEISKESVTLDALMTKSCQLTATITPINSIEPIYWSSSDTNVAKVTNGKVIATGKGTATITATSGTKSATCTVQVESSEVRGKRYYNPSTGKVSTTKNSKDDLGFVLYIPDVFIFKDEDIDKLPLIVFLHGAGERGNNLDVVENWWSKRPFYSKDYPAIFMYPQCNSAEWINIAEKVKGLIDYSIANYNVDENKIAFTGFSKGAAGVWYISQKYPTLFSCVVPVSGYTSLLMEGGVLPDCPVWIFGSTGDGSDDTSKWMYDRLIRNGRKAKLKNDLTVAHASMPNTVYTDTMINWMIERSRKTNSSFQF